jgi:Uma2 family endonuclease
MVALAKPPVRMTVEEFLRWDSGDDRRYELVDGTPRAMAPAGPLHGFLQAEFAAIVRNHLRAQGSGCKAIVAPGVVPKRFFRHNARVPDLAVTCSPILPGQTTLANPVLLVEILSPGNQAKTWTNVWAYTSIPSVLDILILHTDRIAADLLRRGTDGQWPDEATRIAGDVVELESIGLRLALSELYAGTGLSA